MKKVHTSPYRFLIPLMAAVALSTAGCIFSPDQPQLDDTIDPTSLTVSTSRSSISNGDTVTFTMNWRMLLSGSGHLELQALFGARRDTLLVVNQPFDTLLSGRDRVRGEQLELSTGEMTSSISLYFPTLHNETVRFQPIVQVDSVDIAGLRYWIGDQKVKEIYPEGLRSFYSPEEWVVLFVP